MINLRKIVFSGFFFILLLVPLASLGQGQTDTAPSAAPFPDVPENHPFNESIATLKSAALVKGYPEGLFGPDRTINRAEFVTMVMVSVDPSPQGANCFFDVKTEWFAKFICAAKAQGLVAGYPDGSFKPANNINFVEAAAIIAKANKFSTTKAKKGEPWYKPAVAKLEAQAAIPVTVDYPEKKISRGETAEMIWRIKDDVEDKPTKTYESLVAPFPALSSCPELAEKLKAYDYGRSRYIYTLKEDVRPFMVPVPTLKMATEGEAGAMAEEESDALESAVQELPGPPGASDYSSTNVQVEGVDEGDVIKNDGGFIYIVSGNTIRIVRAYPPDQNMAEVTKQTFTDKGFTPSDIYVTQNKLIVIGLMYRPDVYPTPLSGVSEKMMAMPIRYGSSVTKVVIFGMDADRKLTHDRTVDFDGNQISSRRIGNRLFLVTDKTPPYQMYEGENVPMFLPQFKDSRTGKEDLVAECSKIRFLPQYNEMNFLTVANIDTENPESEISREVIMGAGNIVYSSLTDLYVAGARYEYPAIEHFDTFTPPIDNQKTVLYRFNTENGTVTYKNQGAVPGSLLNQFAMDEDAASNTFRVVTHRESYWNQEDTASTGLYVLNRDNLTEVRGKIENIAPGEQLHSVRFMGKRAYFVTFKYVDPFFVVGLDDPTYPEILGELKIPGYSDYLHPFDENHIIGFGKEVDETIDADKVHSNNAVYYTAIQGLKIALFDVSDVKNPKALFKENIGDRGSDSEVLYNHKALLYDKARNLFALPVTVAVIKNKDLGARGGDLKGEVVFQGAYVYTLDLQNGFRKKGEITNSAVTELQQPNYYWYNDKHTLKRVVEIGDYLYGVALGQVKAVKRDDMSEVKKVELEVDTPPMPPILY